MAKRGTLNVVCHGTIAFVVDENGWIELWMPKVDKVWDHRYQAGAWAGHGLASLEEGESYELTGVTPGNGKQRFDSTVNICFDCPGDGPDRRKFRRLRLPPPKCIFPANFIPISPAETFEKPDLPGLKDLAKIATLNVLSYDCDDLEAATLQTVAEHKKLGWIPQVVNDGTSDATNLHIFAEPWTFVPLSREAFPKATLPFNTIAESFSGAANLIMKPPSATTESFFADIDPGAPIPGLPEPEKLALSQHAQMQRRGMLHHHEHPFNCGGTVCQLPVLPVGVDCPRPTKTFAVSLNGDAARVLANPHVIVVHWGSQTTGQQVDEKIQQMLNLQFIQSALAEYQVKPPQLVASIANPHGSKTKIEDAHLCPATLEDSAMARGLADLIRENPAADPRRNPDLLFLIVAAQGAVSEAGVTGSHNFFYLEDGGERIPVPYAWALWGQPGANSLQPIDNLTWTLSHELLEACTDPEPPTGHVFQGPEICDIAAGAHGTVGGIVITGYYSHNDGVVKTPGANRTVSAT